MEGRGKGTSEGSKALRWHKPYLPWCLGMDSEANYGEQRGKRNEKSDWKEGRRRDDGKKENGMWLLLG